MESKTISTEPEPLPLRVTACPHPFRQTREERSLVPGQSLLEILEEVQPDISVYSAHVWVNDEYISPEAWDSTYPAPGSDIAIRVIPQGGAARIIGSIFIAIAAIAAAFVMPWALGLTGPLAGIVGGASGMAVGIVGNLVLNSLFPPTTPKSSQQALAGAPMGSISGQQADSPTLSLTGASNQANKYGPIPLVLGRMKMFPFYGAETYTEIVGSDQYLNL
jgi:hypothetical protein